MAAARAASRTLLLQRHPREPNLVSWRSFQHRSKPRQPPLPTAYADEADSPGKAPSAAGRGRTSAPTTLAAAPRTGGKTSAAPGSAAPGSAAPGLAAATAGAGVLDAAGRAQAAALKVAHARDITLREARKTRYTAVELHAQETEVKKQARDEYQRRYDAAARWWLKLMVGIPIFIISSWHLFNQLYLGNKPPDLPWPLPPGTDTTKKK